MQDVPSVQVKPGKIYHPLSLTCKFPVDTELVLDCQRLGSKPHKGTIIGKMPELHPFVQLKNHVLVQAKAFVRAMKSQGYIPQQAETEMELWGPFREKVDLAKASQLVNFEEGNPFIPQGHFGSAASGGWQPDGVTGPRVLDSDLLRNHRDWRWGVAFIVRGTFLATRGYENDTGGWVV